MSAFDQLTETISSLAQSGFSKARVLAGVGASKAREIAEITRLKLEIATEEESIRKAYQEIGRLYYAERSHAPEGPYTVLCEKITVSKEVITYNEERISDLRTKADLSDEGYSANAFYTFAEEDVKPSPAEAASVPETEPEFDDFSVDDTSVAEMEPESDDFSVDDASASEIEPESDDFSVDDTSASEIEPESDDFSVEDTSVAEFEPESDDFSVEDTSVAEFE
ncbi:MAG: hypothetical protein H6Q60_562, partial [Oscillospiraceae bacterium]|nr:hypothetical protein [Oscillospiraceae bacterium]